MCFERCAFEVNRSCRFLYFCNTLMQGRQRPLVESVPGAWGGPWGGGGAPTQAHGPVRGGGVARFIHRRSSMLYSPSRSDFSVLCCSLMSECFRALAVSFTNSFLSITCCIVCDDFSVVKTNPASTSATGRVLGGGCEASALVTWAA